MKLWINTIAMSLVVFACSFSTATAGNTGSSQANQTSNDDHTVCNDPCSGNKGMPQYRVHSMLVSLNINDTPVGYTPPKGPAVPFTLTYSQRDAYQPTNFTYFNLGQKWNFNWLSYVQDDPQSPGSQVRVYLPGGGTRDYGGYNSTNKTFAPEQRAGVQLVRVTSSNYERRMPDGSKYIYSVSDGSQDYPRRLFLSQIMDASGNSVTLHYDPQNRLIKLTDALGQDSLFEYTNVDPLKITKVIDPFGRRAVISYDADGRLISITDAIDLTSTFTYDSESFITSMTTPYGTTHFSYGQSGTTRWLVITDPAGEQERIEYRHSAPGIPFNDSPLPSGMNLFNRYINSRNTFYWDKEAMKRAPGDYKQARIYHWYHLRTNTSITTGVLESVKNPLEHRVWYNYPGQGWAGAEGTLDKPSKIGRVLHDGTTQLTQKSYNSFGNMTQFIDPVGREYLFDYAYNNIDLIRIRRKNASVFDTLAEFTYNEQHRVLSYKGPNGQLTTYTYNLAGQLTSQTNALGQVTQYIYNEAGYLINIIDPNNHSIAIYQYDSAGRIVSHTDAAGYTLKYDYDGLDRLIKTTYPDKTYSEIKWDKLDIASFTDRHGNQTQYSYNDVQNLIKEIDPALNETDYHYFANDLLASITDPKTNVTQVLRDIQGRMTKTIHADDTQTIYTYDKSARQIQTTDPLEGKTQYGYAKDDRLINVTDPQGNITQYSYDSAGERIKLDSPDTGISHYTYDLNGNRISNTDAKGQRTDYTYDALNRVKTVSYADGQIVDYRYDDEPNGVGRLAEVSENHVTTAFTYDESGHLNSKQQTSLDSINLNVKTTYTIAGLPETITYPSGAVVSYEYYQDRLIGVLYNGTKVIDEITYAAIGKISGWQWGNGLEHFHNYDPNGLLESYSLPEKSLTLTYDTLGNLLTIMGDGVSQNFTYDKLDRLNMAQSSEFELAYDYDPNSNRTEATDAGQITPYTYLIGSNKLDSHAGTTIEYDANGSIVNDGRHAYTYDARGRLTSIDDNIADYLYNDFGQRIEKKTRQAYQLTADLNADGRITHTDLRQLLNYILSKQAPLKADLNWDGAVNWRDIRCVARQINRRHRIFKHHRRWKNKDCRIGDWVSIKQETRFIYDGNRLLGEYNSDGTPKQEHIWLYGQPLATIQDGQLYYVHTDQLGAPKIISNASAKNIWSWESRPFGDTIANEDPDMDGNKFTYNLRFPGQYYDSESGLHYNMYRYYDPSLGRYITSDPIGLEGGLNTYSYVYQNPLNWIDPMGLYTEIIVSDSRVVSRGSQFGHAATDVNGTVYSRAHSKWFKTSREDYLRRQQGFRDSIGLRLDTTPEEEAILVKELEKRMQANTEYDLFSDSCSSNISDALDKIKIQTKGPWQPGAVAPADLLINLPKTGRVDKRTLYEKKK